MWPKLAKSVADDDFIAEYRQLRTKQSPSEQARREHSIDEAHWSRVIIWDLARTYPGHEFFKDKHGEGQKLLYNLNKASRVCCLRSYRCVAGVLRAGRGSGVLPGPLVHLGRAAAERLARDTCRFP